MIKITLKKLSNMKFNDIILSLFNYLFLILFSFIFINVIFFNLNGERVRYNMFFCIVIAVLTLALILILYIKTKNSFKLNRFIQLLDILFPLFISIFIIVQLLFKPFTNNIAILSLLTILYIYINFRIKVKDIDRNFIVEKRYYILILSMVILFIIQCIFVHCILTTVEWKWDVDVIWNSAKSAALTKTIKSTYYFNQYPNNIMILFVHTVLVKIFSTFKINNIELAVVLVNVIVVDITIFITFLVCEKLLNIKLSFLAVLFLYIFLGMSPSIIIPYTDTFGALFPILTIYIYLKIREQKNFNLKILLYISMGMIFYIGYRLKPTCIIAFIAIFLIEIISNINCLKPKQYIKQLPFIISLILTIVMCNFLYSTKVNRVFPNFDKNISFPPTHFVMMGMQGRGGWNGEDVNMTKNQLTKKEKIEMNISVIKQRLSNFGLKRYSKFLSEKACWIMGDGTFFFGREGNFHASKFIYNDKMSKLFQNIFIIDAKYYKLYSNIIQSFWIVILFLIVCPLFLNIQLNKDISIFRMTVFGLLLFLLIFEGRARYLTNHLPIFIILSMYGLNSLYKKIRKEVYL